MVFRCMGSRDRVLEEIRQVGFVPKSVAVERPCGMPFRWSLIIAFVLLWNLAFLLNRGTLLPTEAPSTFPGSVPVLGLAFAFALATAIKWSPGIRRLTLAPGGSEAS
jgi:hypothetical protein